LSGVKLKPVSGNRRIVVLTLVLTALAPTSPARVAAPSAPAGTAPRAHDQPCPGLSRTAPTRPEANGRSLAQVDPGSARVVTQGKEPANRGGLPPPRRPPETIETIDGDLEAAGIVDERSARIAAALQAQDYERAETLLVEAATANPRSADVLRVLGGVFFLRGRPLNAAIALKKAEALAPLDERSLFTLVMAYVAMGRRDWARPELARLAAAHPGNPLYPYWTGRLDYDDGQYAAAVEGFERALELDRRYMKAHDNLGLCYEALGRLDDARRSWEEALRLNDEQQVKSPWPALNLGLLLTRLDRLDEAEARFRESIASDPRFPPARYQLGVTLEKKGRLPEAVAELEEAARLDPAYPEPQYALSRLYRRAGDKEKADRALERFQELKKEKDAKTGRSAPSAP
jgi:tetratricopeptide (TPR) repeat protein